jgi:hypothetical protein
MILIYIMSIDYIDEIRELLHCSLQSPLKLSIFVSKHKLFYFC